MRLPPKRILEVRTVTMAEAEMLGCPTGDAQKSLFGDASNVFAIHFEAVQPEEVPTDGKALKKAADAMEKIKGLSAKKGSLDGETVLEGSGLDSLFRPDASRPVKGMHDDGKGRTVQVPANLIKRFIEHAWPHSPKEYMAWIVGNIQPEKVKGEKEPKTFVYAEALFFPKQTSTSSDVMEIDGGSSEALLDYCAKTGNHVIGWIHSHPTFDAFFSSVDQHMQQQIQKDVELAFGFVVDKDKKVRCMRVEETLEHMATKRLQKQDAAKAAPMQPGGEEAKDHADPPDPVNPAANLKQFQSSLMQIGSLKSWLVKSLSLCFKNPAEASKQFRSLAGSLCGANASLAPVLDDLEISLKTDDIIDFGSLGENLDKIEKERISIVEDLQKAGPIRKMRGRPWGSRNVAKQDDKDTTEGTRTPGAEAGADTAESKNTKRKRPTSSKKKQVPEAEAEVAMADPPPSTDPFAEEEEKKTNKTCTISLYSKCLVVETAKKLHQEGNTVNIEKEVMARFKKYFYSHDTERWKTGLLSKWKKRLVRIMGEMMTKTNQIEDIPKTYEEERHEHIPWQLMSAKDRNAMKQLPDWLRRALGLPERFRQKGHLLHVPWEVEYTFNEILERMLAGAGRDLQSVSNLKTATLVKTAQKVMDTWKATMVKVYKESCFEHGF
eukprot:Skav217163  [mRNA]  locus=scaffold566:173457:177478:+ [translate_table: standard]